MTIYPDTPEAFCELIERLHRVTRKTGVEGPHILSDRRYKDSSILFYRYGGFRPIEKLNVEGTLESFLVSPTGELLPDHRTPYFELPHWVSDPFQSPTPINTAGHLLNDRYEVEEVVVFSNSGGVYEAKDVTTGETIILKEARPHTNCWSVGSREWDAVFLLEREFEILQRLRGLDFVPAAIELFECWTHRFLAEERVSGVVLDTYWAQEDIILAPYIRSPGRIERFTREFRYLARSLIRMVRTVHSRGILLGDLSPRNILIDPDTRHLSLLDFESALLPEDGPEVSVYASEWGTSGFVNPERTQRGHPAPEDDFYSVAMILYGCIVPVNNLFSLAPEAEHRFLAEFLKLGVPIETQTVIEALKKGDAETAEEQLTNWAS